jgi:hypothetical protein
MRSLIGLGCVFTLLSGCAPETSPVEDEVAIAPITEARSDDETIIAMADGWDGKIDYRTPFDALDPGVSPGVIAASVRFDPADEYWGLPRAPGYEDVYYTCSSCHSLRLVMQQSNSARNWSDLVDWMVEHQGMIEPAPDERDRIVDYLATHFPE